MDQESRPDLDRKNKHHISFSDKYKNIIKQNQIKIKFNIKKTIFKYLISIGIILNLAIKLTHGRYSTEKKHRTEYYQLK